MKTYKSKTIFQAWQPTLKKILSLKKNKLHILKECWGDIVPNWAKCAQPSAIKQKTLFLKAPKNSALKIQYQEQELLCAIDVLFKDEITKIKVISS